MAEPREVTITVYGTPAPQGSKRHVGGGRMIEMSKRLAPWREAVKEAALRAREAAGNPPPLTGPLHVEMTFDIKRPKGHYRTGRNAHLLRDGAPRFPAQAPDLSKLARATEDALTDAGAWADDALAVIYAPLAKRWADAPRLPGAVIRIREIQEQQP